jgi:hypothetical protein
MLDVTGIYGTGGESDSGLVPLKILILPVIHHDGPFDACNPHRNRQGTRAAPMQAFPKDSRNMALGGAGPNNSHMDLAQFHGRGEEGYSDYSTCATADEPVDTIKRPAAARVSSFHPTTRAEPLHGEESLGLGTSTFLEGAPASKTAIKQCERDQDEMPNNGAGGLGRKKSLAMKIKGISNNRTVGGRPSSPGRPGAKRFSPTSPLATSQSAHGTTNPFFSDYNNEYEKKTARVESAEEKAGLERGPTSPKRGPVLARTRTTESIGEEGRAGGGGGFLSRVKSLKGGPRRMRGDKRESSWDTAHVGHHLL